MGSISKILSYKYTAYIMNSSKVTAINNHPLSRRKAREAVI